MRRHVAPPDQTLLEGPEPLRGEKDVHVLGHADVAVLSERHAAEEGVRDALGVQPGGEAMQRLVQASFLHEVRARLAEDRIEGPVQLRLVGAK